MPLSISDMRGHSTDDVAKIARYDNFSRAGVARRAFSSMEWAQRIGITQSLPILYPHVRTS